jgi:hypothetical protein
MRTRSTDAIARRSIGLAIASLMMSGCAMTGTVQRMGVEYNTAIAGIVNGVTLLNIVRAEHDMPLHYTSVSKMTGTVTVKATTSVGQFKNKASTVTGTHANANAPTGTTITDTLANQAVTGGNGITPQIGGEIDSGPVFEIAIFDTQNFEQGILAGVPFPIVENYIAQGYDNQLLLRLLVDRVEIRVKDDQKDAAGNVKLAAGTLIDELKNDAYGDKAREFAAQMACYDLQAVPNKKPSKVLAPLSRVTRPGPTGADALKVEDLARFDGKTLDLDGEVTTSPRDDRLVDIVRPAEDKRAAHLEPKTGVCPAVFSLSTRPERYVATRPGLPDTPPPEALYIGHGKVFVFDHTTNTSGVEAAADMKIVFRSPEGVIRAVGRYLRAAEKHPDQTWSLPDTDETEDGHRPLFSVTKGNPHNPVVTTELLGDRYSIERAPHLSENMMVLAIVEQLINLEKSNSDKPSTLPIQLLP